MIQLNSGMVLYSCRYSTLCGTGFETTYGVSMSDDPNIWERIASARTPEVWIAIAAGTLYVYRKSENPKRITSVIEAGISGMLGYAVGPDASKWVGVNDALGVLLVTALGYLALDVITSVVADRAVFKEIIIRRLGGGKNG